MRFEICEGEVESAWPTACLELSRIQFESTLEAASVGAIAVAESDPQVIWVGTGESCARNNVVPGDGVYRTVNGGRTWQHLGLEATKHIAKLRVHPRDPDVAYVAALGDVFVSDAFSAAHRAHASVVGVAQYLPAVAGLLMEHELDYLERSIGKTGILAMRPFLHMTRKDLWQLYVLGN